AAERKRTSTSSRRTARRVRTQSSAPRMSSTRGPRSPPTPSTRCSPRRKKNSSRYRPRDSPDSAVDNDAPLTRRARREAERAKTRAQQEHAAADAEEARQDDAAAGDEPEQKSRSGRNLPAAIGVAAVLIALVGAGLFVPLGKNGEPWGFVGFIALACTLALWEFSTAVKSREIQIAVAPLLVGGVGIVISAYTAGVEA